MRRILEVLPGGSKDGGDLSLSSDDGLEAFVGRRELALHQAEDTVADSARVVIGVLLPLANGLERQQLAADVGEEEIEIVLIGNVEHRSRECRELLLKCTEGF